MSKQPKYVKKLSITLQNVSFIQASLKNSLCNYSFRGTLILMSRYFRKNTPSPTGNIERRSGEVFKPECERPNTYLGKSHSSAVLKVIFFLVDLNK
jgi:hypothetical protein